MKNNNRTVIAFFLRFLIEKDYLIEYVSCDPNFKSLKEKIILDLEKRPESLIGSSVKFPGRFWDKAYKEWLKYFSENVNQKT